MNRREHGIYVSQWCGYCLLIEKVGVIPSLDEDKHVSV